MDITYVPILHEYLHQITRNTDVSVEEVLLLCFIMQLFESFKSNKKRLFLLTFSVSQLRCYKGGMRWMVDLKIFMLS